MTADTIRTVILAGGKGQRLGAQDQPKPLTPINGRPVIEHVMAIFARQGFRDFTIATIAAPAAIRSDAAEDEEGAEDPEGEEGEETEETEEGGEE